jgi:hypothetical protein
MLAGSTDDALQRIAFEFIPADRGQLIEQVKKLAREAPLSAHLSKAFIDEDGQQVASVGSVDDDPDGNVIKHVEHWLAGVAPVLRIVLDAAQKRISLSADLVMSQVRLSFIFEEDKHPLVEEGLRAYFLGQYASAVHLLVPQIEAAIRQLAVHLQVMPYKRDGKNLELRSLGSLLGDPQLTKALTDRFSFYLQVLLTDERGWNLRNEVCHGMLSAQHFGPTFADRIIHVVIALTRIRRSN